MKPQYIDGVYTTQVSTFSQKSRIIFTVVWVLMFILIFVTAFFTWKYGKLDEMINYRLRFFTLKLIRFTFKTSRLTSRLQCHAGIYITSNVLDLGKCFVFRTTQWSCDLHFWATERSKNIKIVNLLGATCANLTVVRHIFNLNEGICRFADIMFRSGSKCAVLPLIAKSHRLYRIFVDVRRIFFKRGLFKTLG